MGHDLLFAIGLLVHIAAGIYMLAQIFRVKWWWGVLGILLPFDLSACPQAESGLAKSAGINIMALLVSAWGQAERSKEHGTRFGP